MLENIGVNFKLGQLFMTTFFCIIMFAKIYTEISYNMPLSEALYISLRVQCLTGSNILPKNKLEKIIVSTQSIIAYLITSGFLIFSIST